MKLRIISGIYGGRNITAPDTDATHPMSERVRNAMFNIISTDIKGKNVLDAFAGSGAVGIEALSRGAAHVTFIERDRKASDALTSFSVFRTLSRCTVQLRRTCGLRKNGSTLSLSTHRMTICSYPQPCH
jgi:16S rRNA (guanine(966)-N(2))-methyltransferase RsmD